MLSRPPSASYSAIAGLGRLAAADAVPGAHVVAVAEGAVQRQADLAGRTVIDLGAGAQVEQRVGAAGVAVVALLERVLHRGGQCHRADVGLRVETNLRAALDVAHAAQRVRAFQALLVVLARGAGANVDAERAAHRVGFQPRPWSVFRKCRRDCARRSRTRAPRRSRRCRCNAAHRRHPPYRRRTTGPAPAGGATPGDLQFARCGAALAGSVAGAILGRHRNDRQQGQGACGHAARLED